MLLSEIYNVNKLINPVGLTLAEKWGIIHIDDIEDHLYPLIELENGGRLLFEDNGKVIL
jgi:hypothetical protein